MAVDAILDRLSGMTGWRRERVADLALLVNEKKLPPAEKSLFVFHAATRATSAGDASAGAFTQMLEDSFSVLLVHRVSAAGRSRALDPVANAAAVLEAQLGGFCPTASHGPLRFVRGALVSAEAGALIWQSDFAAGRQLRNV